VVFVLSPNTEKEATYFLVLLEDLSTTLTFFSRGSYMIDLLKFASNDQLFSFIDFHFVLERFSDMKFPI
jgi:hypothetical protein